MSDQAPDAEVWSKALFLIIMTALAIIIAVVLWQAVFTSVPQPAPSPSFTPFQLPTI